MGERFEYIEIKARRNFLSITFEKENIVAQPKFLIVIRHNARICAMRGNSYVFTGEVKIVVGQRRASACSNYGIRARNGLFVSQIFTLPKSEETIQTDVLYAIGAKLRN